MRNTKVQPGFLEGAPKASRNDDDDVDQVAVDQRAADVADEPADVEPPAQRSAPVATRPRSTPARQQAPTAQYPAVREMPWQERPGQGRPRHVPHPADVLDRRKVERTPLHLSVPAALELEDRLRDFVHFNRVDVPGDVLGVALDEYLAARGY